MGLFKSKTEKYIEHNRVPAELEKYLAVGAVIIHINEPTERVLKGELGPEPYAGGLRQFWSIGGRVHALETIEALLNGQGHASQDQYKEGLYKYQGSLQGVEKTNWEIFGALVADIPGMSAADLSRCQSLLAWDVERAGFVIRASYNAGYISEQETWEFLKESASLAKTFTDWQAYAASYLFGRFLWSGSAAQGDVCEAIKVLVTESSKPQKCGLWVQYPLSGL